MIIKERIEAFSELGEILRNSIAGTETKYSSTLKNIIDTQYQKNPWFTPENVRMAVKAIAEQLTRENLVKWTSQYPELKKECNPMNVGVIMAGNIPLVGFHDFLSVLISGNNVIAKTSSKDGDLIVFISEMLFDINKDFRQRINISEDTLSGFDAVIATGSDNSSRYFEYYFGKYPNIIRKNRNSIAILDGSETDNELEALGNDIFLYFGLGCRNVSKLFVPGGYDFSSMTKAWDKFSGIIHHSKYASNYDFSKAVYIVNRETFIDTGFVLLTESNALSSPVAVIYFEYYNTPDQVMSQLNLLNEKIQVVCGKNNTPFGSAQSPSLWDYADRTDTIAFLLKKKSAGIL